MKYYETTFEEYLQAVERRNFHPDLTTFSASSPRDTIFYGPSGVGKYSQVLYFLQPHSPSQLTYYKKLVVLYLDGTKKIPYTVPMSDIHFEIDMSVLGCKAKKVWHKMFVQIVDILKQRENKHGFLVCKNFHATHSELLEIFYSYMQHYRPRGVVIPSSTDGDTLVQITFILVTEHLSFIPNAIYQSCQVVPVCRPSVEDLKTNLTLSSCTSHEDDDGKKSAKQFVKRITQHKKQESFGQYPFAVQLMDAVDSHQVLNMKEYNCFNLVPPPQQQQQTNAPPPNLRQYVGNYTEDIFNKICDQIIKKMSNIPAPDSDSSEQWFAPFRDALYAILICNLDAAECVSHILTHFIQHPEPLKELTATSVARIMRHMYTFLLYYNNNYRPIYHLENIFIRMVVELHQLPTAPTLT